MGLIAIFLLAGAACGGPLAQLGPGAAGESSVERLAYVSSEGDLFTIRPDGSDRRQLTQFGAPEGTPRRSVHLWPSWSPDGRRIAAVRADLEDGEVERVGLYTIPPTGGEPTELYREEGVLPFFYVWAPNGRALALLLLAYGEVHLRIAPIDGRPARGLDSGETVYFAWSPDSRTVATHVDGDRLSAPSARLSLHPLEADGVSTQHLPLAPTGFRAPAYSPDGQTLVVGARSDDGRTALVAWRADVPHYSLVEGLDRPSFVVSPRGDRVALAGESAEFGGVRDGITLVDLAGGGRQRLTDDLVIAFFWSPDGRRLAWVGVDQVSRGLAWHVSDTAGAVERVTPFFPSPQFLGALGHFDQYATTTSVWSPDSRQLVFAGWVGGDPTDESQVWVILAEANATPRALAPAVMASWSP